MLLAPQTAEGSYRVYAAEVKEKKNCITLHPLDCDLVLSAPVSMSTRLESQISYISIIKMAALTRSIAGRRYLVPSDLNRYLKEQNLIAGGQISLFFGI